jgi:spore maturation protein CgeB
MHRDTHLKAGAPSGRIFEAAAAAAVIISDKHPFVEKEFKNSVLYVDQTRDDLFEQIDTHMRWIKENPEAAKTKALQAHKIFLEKFTLEEQLIRLYENFKTIKLNT